MIVGKTLNITQQLTTGLPAEMVPVFLTFSARTSAKQTQDIIDSKMDKRRKVYFSVAAVLEQLVLPLLKLNFSDLHCRWLLHLSSPQFIILHMLNSC